MKFFSSRWKKPRRNSDNTTRDTRSSAGSDPVITPSFLAAPSYDPPERPSHNSHSWSHDGGTSHHSGGHDHGGSSSYDSGSSGGSDGGGGGGGD